MDHPYNRRYGACTPEVLGRTIWGRRLLRIAPPGEHQPVEPVRRWTRRPRSLAPAAADRGGDHTELESIPTAVTTATSVRPCAPHPKLQASPVPNRQTGDAQALERIRTICLGFAGVEEAELQDRPLFRLGRRRFAIFNGATSPARLRWNSSGRSLHFLADPLELAPSSRIADSHHRPITVTAVVWLSPSMQPAPTGPRSPSYSPPPINRSPRPPPPPSRNRRSKRGPAGYSTFPSAIMDVAGRSACRYLGGSGILQE